jgi:uncharacterized C2H2 Zn-finger protein
MVTYTCAQCQKPFKNKLDYTRHTQRKTPCTDNPRSSIYTEHEKLKQDYNALLTEVEVLRGRLDEKDNTIKQLIANSKTSNKNCHNNITNNVNIVNFGRESRDCLTESDGMFVARSGYRAIHNCVEKMHFNKELPQYQNIKIPNLRANTAKVWDNNKWKTEDKDYVLDQIIDGRSCDIEAFVERYADRIDPKRLEQTKDHLRKIQERDKEYVKQIKKEVQNLIYDNGQNIE